MNAESKSKEAIANLDALAAFKIIEFYESAASVVKGRTWTITTWILTLNAALLAFSIQLYINNSEVHGFLWIQAAICCAGIALYAFLYFFVRDQGNHLSHYWTNENKIGAWNPEVRDFILGEADVPDVCAPNYEAPFPRFCKRLLLLSFMFAVGFAGTFLLMWVLIVTAPKT